MSAVPCVCVPIVGAPTRTKQGTIVGDFSEIAGATFTIENHLRIAIKRRFGRNRRQS